MRARELTTAPRTDDALASLALEYTTRSVRFISGRPPDQFAGGPPGVRPSPAEIVLWFHSRIYFKTMRALVGRALADTGTDRFEDPRVCAKQTLIAVDRSRAALTQLRGEDVERTALLALLDAIARGMEERFGCGRAFAPVSTGRQPGAGTNKKPASFLKRAAT